MDDLSAFWFSDRDTGSKTDKEVFVDENGIYENDNRAVTRTQINFKHENASSHINWEKLKKINDGMFCKERKQQNRDIRLKKDADLFFNYLGLSPKEYERGMYMKDKVDLVRGKEKSEALLLAIATLVSDENCTEFEERLSNQDEFETLLDINDLEYSDVKNYRNHIREEYDFF